MSANADELLQQAIAKGLTLGCCIHAFGKAQDDWKTNALRQAAEKRCSDGVLEVDNYAPVSWGEAEGGYVLTWLWIDNEAAGIV